MSRGKKTTLRPTKHTPLSLVLTGIGIGIFLCLAIFGLEEPTPAYLPEGETAPLNIIALDVGQGDATLVLTDSYTMLIDCGDRGGEQLMDSYLQAYGVTQIDTFIITHPHSDHMGTAPHIIDNYPIGEIILPDLPNELIPTTNLFSDFLTSAEQSGADTRLARVGDSIDLGGGATAEIIGPTRTDYKDLNDFSVSLIVRLGDAAIALTGDAESPAERDMVESGRLVPCDVLLVGHHGSNTSSSKPFLAALMPKTAVISTGADNRYGHPHADVLTRLEDIGAAIFRTDVDGTVQVATDGTAIRITTTHRELDLAA